MRSELSINTQRLTAGYRPQCCWFELFESARKVILICLPVFFPLGSPAQYFFGLVACFVCCCTLLSVKPYEQYSDHLVAVLSQVC